MNDLLKELPRKVILVIYKIYFIFMTVQEVCNSVQMKFKNDVSYNMIKHPNAGFWKNVHESWCSHMSKNIKDSYDLSNHKKVPNVKSKYKYKQL